MWISGKILNVALLYFVLLVNPAAVWMNLQGKSWQGVIHLFQQETVFGQKQVWCCQAFKFYDGACCKVQMMRSLVTSIFLYTCESWTLTAELQRRIWAMEMRCNSKILCISNTDHVTNEEVHDKIKQAIGPHEDLLTIVKRCKLQWFGHVSCSSGVAKPSWKAQWKGEEDKADRGRDGKTTSGNGHAWSSPSPRGSGEQRKMEETGCEIICGAQTNPCLMAYTFVSTDT